ncbi:hypothetical protein Agub_g3390 [Astrephomene gubernaculifera]|uniref:Uncharacterized protein n=1 Tax=Astrephomene gubernaculifera TaxID=47775 RepID=A0AAD3DIJ8_9CHLO|nr:hypothetical protein Agub_g3390 [Astrephomene gubernaculifera]
MAGASSANVPVTEEEVDIGRLDGEQVISLALSLVKESEAVKAVANHLGREANKACYVLVTWMSLKEAGEEVEYKGYKAVIPPQMAPSDVMRMEFRPVAAHQVRGGGGECLVLQHWQAVCSSTAEVLTFEKVMGLDCKDADWKRNKVLDSRLSRGGNNYVADKLKELGAHTVEAKIAKIVEVLVVLKGRGVGGHCDDETKGGQCWLRRPWISMLRKLQKETLVQAAPLGTVPTTAGHVREASPESEGEQRSAAMSRQDAVRLLYTASWRLSLLSGLQAAGKGGSMAGRPPLSMAGAAGMSGSIPTLDWQSQVPATVAADSSPSSVLSGLLAQRAWVPVHATPLTVARCNAAVEGAVSVVASAPAHADGGGLLFVRELQDGGSATGSGAEGNIAGRPAMLGDASERAGVTAGSGPVEVDGGGFPLPREAQAGENAAGSGTEANPAAGTGILGDGSVVVGSIAAVGSAQTDIGGLGLPGDTRTGGSVAESGANQQGQADKPAGASGTSPGVVVVAAGGMFGGLAAVVQGTAGAAPGPPPAPPQPPHARVKQEPPAAAAAGAVGPRVGLGGAAVAAVTAMQPDPSAGAAPVRHAAAAGDDLRAHQQQLQGSGQQHAVSNIPRSATRAVYAPPGPAPAPAPGGPVGSGWRPVQPREGVPMPATPQADPWVAPGAGGGLAALQHPQLLQLSPQVKAEEPNEGQMPPPPPQQQQEAVAAVAALAPPPAAVAEATVAPSSDAAAAEPVPGRAVGPSGDAALREAVAATIRMHLAARDDVGAGELEMMVNVAATAAASAAASVVASLLPTHGMRSGAGASSRAGAGASSRAGAGGSMGGARGGGGDGGGILGRRKRDEGGAGGEQEAGGGQVGKRLR